MKQEDKDLLLQDLCGRIPYRVKINHIADTENNPITLVGIAKTMITLESPAGYGTSDIEDYIPYLFPLSSMTEEQYNSLHELGILDNCSHSYKYVNPHIYGVSFIFKQFKTYSLELIEWLNKNHFDYRGLIEKGLAIDATNLNIY